MKYIKSLMIAEAIIRCVYFACVTAAAIAFEKTGILWWYILGLFMGFSFKCEESDDNG